VARDDDLWMPPPDPSAAPTYLGYPPYQGSVVPSPLVDEAAHRAARRGWLERRFPGSAATREAREAKRARLGTAGAWLLSAAVLTFVVWVVVNGFPETPDRTAPWASVVFIVIISAWILTAVPLAILTRGRPAVAEADVDILARLTRSERRALVADMRAAEPQDPDDLDVVAAAWLKSRTEVLFVHPFRAVFLTSVVIRWFPTPWVVLPVLLVAWALWEIADGVPRLLAARAWLRRRAAHDDGVVG
jgi:hypothetical protein